MRIRIARGLDIAYDDEGQGLPLVLLHAHPFHRQMWRAQVEAFRTSYRVIAPDLRGYGESSIVPGKVTMEEMAADVVRLLDELGIDKAVICGISMGGHVAFELCRKFMERIRALVLVDTSAHHETEEGVVNRRQMADWLIRHGMKAYAESNLQRFIAERAFQSNRPLREHLFEMMCQTNPEGGAAALRGRAERPDYRPLLPGIEVPALVIVGSEDEFTPVEDAMVMSRGIPQGSLCILDGVGHLPNMEEPARFHQVVLEFLGQM